MDLNHKRIAVLGLKRIGDAVYTLPTFEAVKRSYPTATITVFTESQVAAIYQQNPFIDKVQTYPKKEFWKGVLHDLKVAKFDVCIINHNALKYAALALFAGVPVRVGYQKEGRSVLLTHKRPLPNSVVHRLEHNALLLDLLSIESRDLFPSIYESVEEVGQADNLLEHFGLLSGEYLVFIVGSIAETRRWFPENFAKLALKIESQLKLKVVILGGPDDREIAGKITNICSKGSSGLVNLAGETSLRETILLFKRARAVVSNDTGPLHVASALRVPVVTWFGAGDERATAPTYNRTVILNAHLNCAPCLKEKCPLNTLECLHKITPELVFNELKKII